MLRVGTDCSGIEAPLQALKLLNIEYEHVFSSDIDKYARLNIINNYNPKILYEDITERNHNELEQIDMYICGFPCQTFSLLGKREGFRNKVKGTIFFECLTTIECTKPTVFVLENVKGLVNHNDGDTLDIILDNLNSIGKYNLYWKILNTLDYGLPQNRERLYIVGIKRENDKGFQFPIKQPLLIHIEDILDTNPPEDDYFYRLTEHKKKILDDLIEHKKIDDLNKPWLVNLNVSSYKRTTPMYRVCPTLLAGNGGDCIHYLTSHKRRLTPTEYLRLQGFPDTFQSIVPRTQLYRQIGNSMSVNVLCALFTNIFKYLDTK